MRLMAPRVKLIRRKASTLKFRTMRKLGRHASIQWLGFTERLVREPFVPQQHVSGEFVGMDKEESDSLLQDLYVHQTQ